MRRLAPLLAVLALAIAPAAAQAQTQAYQYTPFDQGRLSLVPGGVVVPAFDGRTIAVTKFADTGGGEVLASFKLNNKVAYRIDDADLLYDTDGSNIVASFAQDWSGNTDTIHPLGGDVFAGPVGTTLPSLHRCNVDTNPTPVDLDGTHVAYVGRTTCAPGNLGGRVLDDVVVRDLTTGGDTLVAHDVIAGGVSLAYPYVAFTTGTEAQPEGDAVVANRVRVYDLRTNAVVTDITADERTDLRRYTVDSAGTLLGCTGVARAAAPGATTFTETTERCGSVQRMADGRLFVTRGRVAFLFDPQTGTEKALIKSKVLNAGFASDGQRIAWTGASCSSASVMVAPAADLAANPVSDPKVTCAVRFGKKVVQHGRTVTFTVTCADGCAGDAQLYGLGGDGLPLVDADVNPEPGKRTTVKLTLDASDAKKLAKAKRVQLSIYSIYTNAFRRGTRTLLHR